MDIGQGFRSDLCGEQVIGPCNCSWSLTNCLDQAVYQSLLHLTWVDKLLDNIRAIFVNVYKDQLKAADVTARTYPFDPYFDQQMKELEANTGEAVTADPPRANIEVKKASSEE